MVQFVGNSFSDFKNDSLANRESAQAGQNWLDLAVPRLVCNNSRKGFLNHFYLFTLGLFTLFFCHKHNHIIIIYKQLIVESSLLMLTCMQEENCNS